MRIQVGGLDLQIGRKETGMSLVTEIPWTGGSGWFPAIRESFAGAWQRNVLRRAEDVVAHPTFFACLTLIASDFGKLRPTLIQFDDDGVGYEVTNPSYSPVIAKPNHYQDYIQFQSYWISSKMTRGNTYGLKERDNRNVVTGIYILDPSRVRPMVAPNGDVYYALGADTLSGVGEENVVVPAREIIHDRFNAIYHPLCGLSPIFACGLPALTSSKMMRNTSTAAEHGSVLGGILVAPGKISAETAKRLEDHWNSQYAGPENIGKIAAIGDGLKFEKPQVMSAVDAQIIDQLKWNDEKICAVMHVPGYMVNVGPLPSFNNVEALTQVYYGQCLQFHVESYELCFSEGVVEGGGYEMEMDLEGLDRFDSLAKTERLSKGVQGGLLKLNEARRSLGKRRVPSGDTPWMQEQMWPVDKLAARPVPTKTAPAPASATPAALPPAPAKKDLEYDVDALVGASLRILYQEEGRP